MRCADFGPMPGKVDQNLLERALATPRARRADHGSEQTLDEVRAKFGASLSDEDLLLRAVMPSEQVDAMAQRRHANRSALGSLLASLEDDKRPYSLSISAGGASLSLAGGAPEGQSRG